MDDFLDRYGKALDERLGESDEDAGLFDEESELLLDLARDVAHATERVNAPLATFVAGRYTALRESGGADRAAALREAIETAREQLKSTESPQ